MKIKFYKNTTKLLLAFILLSAMVSCSEEIVLIEEKDRTELDSLEVQISVISESIRDAKTEKDALQRRLDSLNALAAPAAKNAVHYTVQVSDGSAGYVGGRLSSLSNALVTVSQGTTVQEITTDDTGMATFPEMESGFISLTVEITGYSDVYMIVDLRDAGGTGIQDLRYASTHVMVFPTEGSSMFTISGTSYYNQNLDNLRTGAQNDPFHPFTGPDIYETVPQGISFIVECVPSTIPNNTSEPGRIIQAVYAGLTREGTTDANGDWTITLPVVFLTDGNNLFNYFGPFDGDTFEDTQTSLVNGNTIETWAPGTFYPNSIDELTLFPGGNSIQDLYYFTL